MTASLSLTIPEPTPFAQLTSLAGRCAVVTGGSRGIGEAIVHRLAQAGASVVFTGRGKDALERVEADIAAAGGEAVGVQADVGNIADTRRVIDLAVSRFGGIDILVNNAAVFPVLLSIEMTEEVWDHTIDTDLKGAFFAAKMAANEMIKAAHGGRIINLLSAEIVRPTGFLAAYGAAKAGLQAATQSMATELGKHGILVNAIIVGSTITADRIASLQSGEVPDMYEAGAPDAGKTRQARRETMEKGEMAQRLATMPLGRPGFPDDLAKAVLFLASDMAGYVSGTSLTVDGAQTLR